MNQYLAFKAHSFLAPGRRLSSHREVTQIYLDLFPQGVTTTSPQTLNFTDSTLPGMVGYKLSFHVDLIPEVYMLYLPFLSITHTHRAKGYIKTTQLSVLLIQQQQSSLFSRVWKEQGSFLKSQQGEQLTTKNTCICTNTLLATFKVEAEVGVRQPPWTERLNWPGKM